jgi:membrane dipeptidase
MKDFQTRCSRPRFLSTVATASAGMMRRSRSAWASDMTDPQVAEIVVKTIGIDTHNHVDVPLTGRRHARSRHRPERQDEAAL